MTHSATRAFCTPAFWSEERAALIVSARRRRARRFTAMFLERFASRLEPSLVATLSRLEALAGPPDPHHDRALTALGHGLRSGDEGAPLAAVRAALQLSTGGVPVDFEQRLPEPCDVAWHGRLLRSIDRVCLHADAPDRIELGRGAQQVRLDRVELGDRGALALPEVTLGSELGARRASLLLPWCVSASPVLASASPLAVLPGREVAQQLERGWALVVQTSARYAAWCRDVLSEIVPIQGGETFSMSASCRESPGQIAVSIPASPAVLAELFVHECSHENLSLAIEHGPLDDGSDTTLYWSPVKRTGRPIDRILLAHHAFINILCFQRELVEQDLDHDGYARANYEQNVRAVEQLESALRQTRSLTDVGRALYLPLEEALS
jgi:HEXXH motif-containing protein